MSEAGKENFRRYLKDAPKAQISGEWRKGPSITADYLKTCGEDVLLVQEWQESRQLPRSNAAKKPESPASLVGFGKHKSLTLRELKKEQPGYWRWALEEIPEFESRVRAAGL